MTKTEALELTERLWKMACDAAGAGRDDEINRITRELGMHARDGYTREKLREARQYLLIWNAPRKWQRWGHDTARSNVLGAVGKLQMAIETEWDRPRQ